VLSSQLHPKVVDIAGTFGSEQVTEGVDSARAPEIPRRAAKIIRT